MNKIIFLKKIKTALVLTLIFTTTSCGLFFHSTPDDGQTVYKSSDFAITKVPYSALPSWENDDSISSLKSFQQSCKALNNSKNNPVKTSKSNLKVNWDDVKSTCNKISKSDFSSQSSARKFFQKHFDPYLITTEKGKAKGTITGYYETVLHGSKSYTNTYKHPVYAKPSDAKNMSYSRKEIYQGALKGKTNILYFIDNPVDVFDLHVQGSGVINLENGESHRICYAGNNGYDFKSLSQIIKGRDIKLPSYSMSSMKNYLKSLPDNKTYDILSENPRFIYHAELKTNQTGPNGTLGTPLLPRKSIAVDRDYIPLGLPIFLESKDPDGKNLNGLVVAQDTGSAIKGPIRADFYWGTGDKAFNKAARMKQQGSLYIFLPK